MPRAHLVKDEADSLAEKRRLEVLGCRTRTIVTSVESTMRRSLSREVQNQFKAELRAVSRRIGVIRSCVGVFLNAMVDSSGTLPVCQMVFDSPLHMQLWRRVIGDTKKARGRAPAPYHSLEPAFQQFLHNYVEKATEAVGRETLEELSLVPAQVRAYAAQEMFQSLKRQVCESRFLELATGHIAARLEKEIFSARPLDRLDNDSKERCRLHNLAKKVFWACGEETVAEAKTKYLSKVDSNWRAVMFDVILPLYRHEFSLLRHPKKKSPVELYEEGKKAKSGSKKRKRLFSCSEQFRLNIVDYDGAKLFILCNLRAADEDLQELKLSRYNEMNEYQPKVSIMRPVSGYTPSCFKDHLSKLPFTPDWMKNGRRYVTDDEAQALFTAIRQRREYKWKELYRPGLLCLPKAYALLPLPSVCSAFIQLNAQTLQWFGLRAFKRSLGSSFQPATPRVWWTSMLEFHRQSVKILKPRKKHRKLSRKQKRRRYKPLRQRIRWKRGIPMLKKDAWMFGDDATLDNMQDRSRRMPWLVQGVSTNGLELHVQLSGFEVRNHPKYPEAASLPLPPAIPELPNGLSSLHERGYQFIQQKANIGVDTKGLFRRVGAAGPGMRFEAVGVDPGHVKLVAQVQASVKVNANGHKEVSDVIEQGDLENSFRYFKGSTYKERSGRLLHQRYETRRRALNEEYKAALEELNAVSMKHAGGSAAYAEVFNRNLTVLMNEKGRERRRQLRFFMKRSQMRLMNKLTDFIAYGSEQAAVWKSLKCGKEKRHMARELRSRPRVVFFGDGQFPQGSHGPLPRKKVLRSLAFKCPVVLTGEFRTSKYCFYCNAKMGSAEKGSRVLRCPSIAAGEGPCPGSSIDRDMNGAANILKVGLCQLLGLPRPTHLRRERKHTIPSST